jgi:hypothetical protein
VRNQTSPTMNTGIDKDLSTMNPARRTLAFDSLDRVMPDVDHLLEGHATVGNWSLSQVCNHLAKMMISSVEGFPEMAPWVLRKSIGPIIIRRLVKNGRFPEGIKLSDVYLPTRCDDARAEAEALRATLSLFSAHTGTFAEHSLGAKLSRREWERLHCIHCAHHLSFVLPAAAVRSIVENHL